MVRCLSFLWSFKLHSAILNRGSFFFSSPDDGTITASLPPDADQILDITDGIEKSVELEQELSQNMNVP